MNLEPRLAHPMTGPKSGIRARVLHGSVGGLLVKSAYVGLQFLISVVLARALGVAGFGVYSFALAIVALVLIPAQFGFPAYVVRMTAVYLENRQHSLLLGLWDRSFQIVTAASLAVAVTVALAIMLLGIDSSGGSGTTILIGLCVVPPMALLLTSGGALRGLGYVIASQVAEQVGRPVIMLALLVVLVSFATVSSATAMLINLGSTMLALLMAQVMLRRVSSADRIGGMREFATAEWIRGSTPFMLLAGTQMINHQVDILMLGVMTTSEDVGRYRVAVQVADALMVVMAAISAAIAPHLASVHARNDWQTIRRLLVTSHRIGFAILAPIAVLLAVVGEPMLRVVFGPAYGEAANAMLVLAIGKALYATVGFCGIALSMFGHASSATVVTLVMTVANVGMNFLLIPAYGIEGAAIATSTSMVVVNGALALWMMRRFGVNMTAVGRRDAPTRVRSEGVVK